tara:strand:+ start:74 stop:574 length:501 start_codon:yes stop_codon:yes gene_type:complete
MTLKKYNHKKLAAIVLDFDGVLTDNRVLTFEDGKEAVFCNRSDGLAVNVLNNLKIRTFILSSEKNKVVKYRAKKLKIDCFHSIKDKENELRKISKKEKLNLKNVMYVGNDLNDFKAMKICGIKVCPCDSHIKIKKIANFKTKARGGNGVLREIVENFLEIDMINNF